MSKVGSWSTTANSNNFATPDGWPEGQLPSTVNNCAREMMAQIKTVTNSLEYMDIGTSVQYLSATTFSLAAADTVNFTIGRRIKAFCGGPTVYGTIYSVSATQIGVRLDSGALDTSLSSVALGVVTPDNTGVPPWQLGRKNLLINGSMDIWQRSATFQVANNTQTYTADRWSMFLSTGGALAVSRSTDVPTVQQAGVLLTSSLLVSVSAVDAAVAAGEFVTLNYRVEGFDFRQLAQKPMNLSFWCKTRQSGIYAVAVKNTASDRSFVQNFTVSAIATWTRFSIPIPKSPTGGTWDYSNGVGLQVVFTLEGGSTYQGGAGNWTAANVFATSSQVNFLQSAGNTFALTGVQLEEGNLGTALEILPFGLQFQQCQRYFQQIAQLPGALNGTSVVEAIVNFTTPMRAAPTLKAITEGSIIDGVTNYSISSAAIVLMSGNGGRVQVSIKGAAGTAGRGAIVYTNVATSVFEFDAEL